MAKPIPKTYADAIAEYQTGLYPVAYIAKKYKIPRVNLATYISKNKIKVNEIIKNGIVNIDKGLSDLQNSKQEIINSTFTEPKKADENLNALSKGFEYLESKHGELAKYVVNLVAKGFKKGDEMLEIAETPEQYKYAMQGIKTGADTLGLFPKSPLIAIQQNINKEINQGIQARDFKINVNFIKADEKKAEVIDVTEIIENGN